MNSIRNNCNNKGNSQKVRKGNKFLGEGVLESKSKRNSKKVRPKKRFLSQGEEDIGLSGHSNENIKLYEYSVVYISFQYTHIIKYV